MVKRGAGRKSPGRQKLQENALSSSAGRNSTLKRGAGKKLPGKRNPKEKVLSPPSGRKITLSRGAGRKLPLKRNPPESIDLIDLDQTATEVPRSGASKRGSHFVARGRYRKNLTQDEAENVGIFQHAPTCRLDVFPYHTRSRSKLNRGKAVASSKERLDSRAFECYLQTVWRNFSESEKSNVHFTYLDCLWFNLYLKAQHRSKVLKWIQNKEIFSKKYVLVPIVCWKHWSLLIFCHFGESLESERKPCMLLLDSLQKADSRRIEPDIRKFVLDVFKEEGRCENLNFTSKIPLLVPEVPQQRNGEECGNFVLYFIHLFMEGAPENFNIEEYPYFMTKNWFTLEAMDQFIRKLGHFEE